MKTPEEIADFIWSQQCLGHDEMAIDNEMYWEDFVSWIKDEE